MNKELIAEIKNKISPQKYNEILRTVDLTNLYLNETSAKLNQRDWTGAATLNLSEKSELLDSADNKFTIEMNYLLKAQADNKDVVEISAQYIIEFTTDGAPDKDFIELFKIYSLPLHSYPFFREIVNSFVIRMDLPSLILPLRKFLVSEKVTT